MQRVLIIGATSAIAKSTARRYAQRANVLFLVGRDKDRLDIIADDLNIRGASRVHTYKLDINDLTAHAAMIEAATRAMGGIDIALIAHGTLPDQTACDASLDLAMREFTTNAIATIALSSRLSAALNANGTLAVISSVAGDRGRSSNYLYGSAKAAVSTYLSGLGQRLHEQHINVLTIKPGFVDTPMTANFKKSALWTTPEKVATGIIHAIDRRRSIAYLPHFWWIIMQVIKNIPEFAFRRIKL